MRSFPFDQVNIIANFPQDFHSFLGEFPIKVWSNVFRQDWHTGSIAWCWNQAMLHTFEERDWCVMSQDDVGVIPGWDALINNSDFDTYIAPHGDVVQVQSLTGFARVGWFDERFRAIGGPEADYLLRLLRCRPDLLSVHDEHIWQLRLNDIGLASHFLNVPKSGELAVTRFEHNESFADAECFDRWVQKWGCGVDDLFLSHDYHHARNPGWDEIDWYPSFTRRMVSLGRLNGGKYAECL